MNREGWNSYKGLWALTIPSILASMLEPLSSVVDTALVGRFDTQALASLAIGASLISSLTWMFNFLVHVPIQQISEKIGKGSFLEVISLTKIAYFLAFCVWIILLIIITPFRFEIYHFMGATENLVAKCDDYFLIRLIGQISVLFFIVSTSVLRGFAKVRIVLIIIGLCTTSNIILSYLSLYSLDLGLKGVAIATVVSNFIGAVFAFIVFLREKEIKGYFLSTKLNSANIKSMGTSSFNIFGRSALLTLCFFLSTKVAAQIGVFALAAHQITLQIWLFASFFTDGIATTGNIVGARLMGSQNIKTLRGVIRKLTAMGFQVGLFFMLSFYFGFNTIVERFTTDQAVLNQVESIWWLMVLFQGPLAIAYVYDGILFGFDRFAFLRKHMTIAFFLVFLPCLWLAQDRQSLLLLWLAISLVGVYRLISNYFGIRNRLKESCCE